MLNSPARAQAWDSVSHSYDIVVNKHNGELFVKSAVVGGTKFTIKLPIGTKKMTSRR
jgi:signal transduction histidine kinase